MRNSFYNVYLKILSLLLFIDLVLSLQCWKCISDDCTGNPENNYKAEKVACKQTESCLKVLYKMQDNKTLYESVIRTCSSGECFPTSDDEYEECLQKDHGYLVLGCSKRYCCDEDMCNDGKTLTVSWGTMLFILSGNVLLSRLLRL